MEPVKKNIKPNAYRSNNFIQFSFYREIIRR